MIHEKENWQSSMHCTGGAKRKAITAVPSARNICTGIKTSQRWQRGNIRRAAVGSGNDASDAFVKMVFVPKLDNTTFMKQKELKISKKMNGAFKTSLNQLMEHYDLIFKSTDFGNYAFNWLVAIEMAQDSIKSKGDIEIQLVNDGTEKVALQTKQYFSSGSCLYYLPVVPLYRFLKDRKFRTSRPAVLILLSACCYLFKYAGVPMYTEDCNYIAYEYDTLLNWYEEDEETEYRQSYLKELEDIMAIGKMMELKFYNEHNLKFLDQRINNLKPRDQFDRYCLIIGMKTLDLYKNHRDKNVFRYAADINNETWERDDVTKMDQYISFVGTSSGGVSDMLLDMINNELSEHSKIQEPEITCLFNGGPVPGDGFQFEELVFGLIDDVCTVLNNY